MVGKVPLYAYLVFIQFLKHLLLFSVRDRKDKMSFASGLAWSFLCIDSILKGFSLMGSKLIILITLLAVLFILCSKTTLSNCFFLHGRKSTQIVSRGREKYRQKFPLYHVLTPFTVGAAWNQLLFSQLPNIYSRLCYIHFFL